MHLFDTFWSPGVLYKAAEPYILAAWSALVTVGISYISFLAAKKLHLSISASAQDELERAATNAAGRILASQEKTFANTKIDLHNPLVAAEVPMVIDGLSKAVRSSVAPQDVQKLILAKLGTVAVSK